MQCRIFIKLIITSIPTFVQLLNTNSQKQAAAQSTAFDDKLVSNSSSSSINASTKVDVDSVKIISILNDRLDRRQDMDIALPSTLSQDASSNFDNTSTTKNSSLSLDDDQKPSVATSFASTIAQLFDMSDKYGDRQVDLSEPANLPLALFVNDNANSKHKLNDDIKSLVYQGDDLGAESSSVRITGQNKDTSNSNLSTPSSTSSSNQKYTVDSAHQSSYSNHNYNTNDSSRFDSYSQSLLPSYQSNNNVFTNSINDFINKTINGYDTSIQRQPVASSTHSDQQNQHLTAYATILNSLPQISKNLTNLYPTTAPVFRDNSIQSQSLLDTQLNSKDLFVKNGPNLATNDTQLNQSPLLNQIASLKYYPPSNKQQVENMLQPKHGDVMDMKLEDLATQLAKYYTSILGEGKKDLSLDSNLRVASNIYTSFLKSASANTSSSNTSNLPSIMNDKIAFQSNNQPNLALAMQNIEKISYHSPPFRPQQVGKKNENDQPYMSSKITSSISSSPYLRLTTNNNIAGNIDSSTQQSFAQARTQQQKLLKNEQQQQLTTPSSKLPNSAILEIYEREIDNQIQEALQASSGLLLNETLDMNGAPIYQSAWTPIVDSLHESTQAKFNLYSDLKPASTSLEYAPSVLSLDNLLSSASNLNYNNPTVPSPISTNKNLLAYNQMASYINAAPTSSNSIFSELPTFSTSDLQPMFTGSVANSDLNPNIGSSATNSMRLNGGKTTSQQLIEAAAAVAQLDDFSSPLSNSFKFNAIATQLANLDSMNSSKGTKTSSKPFKSKKGKLPSSSSSSNNLNLQSTHHYKLQHPPNSSQQTLQHLLQKTPLSSIASSLNQLYTNFPRINGASKQQRPTNQNYQPHIASNVAAKASQLDIQISDMYKKAIAAGLPLSNDQTTLSYYQKQALDPFILQALLRRPSDISTNLLGNLPTKDPSMKILSSNQKQHAINLINELGIDHQQLGYGLSGTGGVSPLLLRNVFLSNLWPQSKQTSSSLKANAFNSNIPTAASELGSQTVHKQSPILKGVYGRPKFESQSITAGDQSKQKLSPVNPFVLMSQSIDNVVYQSQKTKLKPEVKILKIPLIVKDDPLALQTAIKFVESQLKLVGLMSRADLDFRSIENACASVDSMLATP